MRIFLYATLLLAPVLAQAHPGHDHEPGFLAGALHPFTGLDHLAGIVAAGLLLGWLRPRGRWLIGVAFIAMLAGTHAWWLPADVGAGFIAGLLGASGLLIACSFAATRVARQLAAARETPSR